MKFHIFLAERFAKTTFLNGKGFRSGSEFWRLHENIGDDVSGLKMTLTKSERGLGDKHIERISKPTEILNETAGRTLKNNRFYSLLFLRPDFRNRNSQKPIKTHF